MEWVEFMPFFLSLLNLFEAYEQFLALRARRVARKRKSPVVWQREFLKKRPKRSVAFNLLPELSDPTAIGHATAFRQYMRLDAELFLEIVDAVGPHIERVDTNWRSAITSQERLAMTFRFLATGCNYSTLQAEYLCERSTITKIIPEVCEALVTVYEAEVLHVPFTQAEWKAIADRFSTRWNFHHTLGALDGKHVRIRNPPKGASEYFNYKRYFSIIMMALVDADYRFIYLDIGQPGANSDAGIFNRGKLFHAFQNQLVDIPPPEILPNDDQPMPYFLIADEAFGLRTWLQKPYPQFEIPPAERLFNYRLSRARRCVECAFGILASR